MSTQHRGERLQGSLCQLSVQKKNIWEKKRKKLTKFDQWDRKGVIYRGTIKAHHHFSRLHFDTNHLLQLHLLL